MSVTFSEQGKRKIIEGMLAMPDSPFWETNEGEILAKYDDIRIGRTDDGRLSVELAYHGKSVLTMYFDMPAGAQRLSIVGQGTMPVNVQVNDH